MQSKEEVLRHSYAEAAVLHSTLAAQLELLNFGISSGTCIVVQASPQRVQQGEFDPFELHFYTQLFGRACESARLPVPPLLEDFLLEDARQPHFIFSPDFQVFLAAYLQRPDNVMVSVDRLE